MRREAGDVIGAGILHPAVGVVHHPAGGERARHERHVQGLQREVGLGSCAASAQPTTRRLWASRTNARKAQASARLT